MVSKINENVGGIASYTKALVKSLKMLEIDVEITNLKQSLLDFALKHYLTQLIKN